MGRIVLALKYAYVIGFGLFLLSPFWVSALQRARCRRILRQPSSIQQVWVTPAEEYTDCELYALINGEEKLLATFADVRPTVQSLLSLGVAVKNTEVLEVDYEDPARPGGQGVFFGWFSIVLNTLSLLSMWSIFLLSVWHLVIKG
jgi:hypothetical protein